MGNIHICHLMASHVTMCVRNFEIMKNTISYDSTFNCDKDLLLKLKNIRENEDKKII